MARGPSGVLEVWKYVNHPFDQDGLPSLWQQCEGILMKRGLDNQQRDVRIHGAIISGTAESNDTCESQSHSMRESTQLVACRRSVSAQRRFDAVGSGK